MKRIREALAVLELPQAHACILPGHGWRPPDAGWIKINTDGSIAMQSRRGGAGGVAQGGFFGGVSVEERERERRV